VPREELTLRVLRNGTQLRDVELGKGRSMVVPDIGLKLGDNAITAAYVLERRRRPESNSVTVTRDGSAPSVDVASPIDGSTTSGSEITVAGRAETGGDRAGQERDRRERKRTLRRTRTARFRHRSCWLNGDNKLSVTATDTAGNETTVTRTGHPGSEGVDLQLELSQNVCQAARPARNLKLSNLRVALEISATLTNGTGTGDDGASVTFSVSPPGVPDCRPI